MDKNPATDATLPKYKAEEREIWTAEMLMQAIDACENKWLKVAFHLAFAATVRIGELLGLTWDCVDISEEAISENRHMSLLTNRWSVYQRKLLRSWIQKKSSDLPIPKEE